MLSRTKRIAALAVGLMSSTSAFAGAVVSVLNELPRCFTCYAYNVDIGFDVNFYGLNYSQARINSAGGILLQYQGGTQGATLNPLWLAAIDTREGGSPITYGNLLHEGHMAFAVNWVDVAPYENKLDARNSFQLVLVDRSDTGVGNFDFIFNYDSIQWLNTDANYGNPSSVYYTTSIGGDPEYGYWTEYGFEYENIKPSLNAYQLPNTRWNSDVDGRWIFEVRNGAVINPLPVRPPIPEPETWAMLLAGLGIVGAITRRKRIKSAA